MISHSFRSAKFPAQLKCLEVNPLYKAADPLIEINFRPVCIPSRVSKVYERINPDLMYEYFMGNLSFYLSAFRKKYGCEHVLIKLIEEWKSALGTGENAGFNLMDLTKAFDCLLTDYIWPNYMLMVYQTNHENWSDVILWEDNNVLR